MARKRKPPKRQIRFDLALSNMITAVRKMNEESKGHLTFKLEWSPFKPQQSDASAEPRQ